MRLGPVVRSFGYAFAGLGYAVRTQRNVRIQLACAAIVVALGVWLDIGPRDWALLVSAVGLVIAAEVCNTALETVVNLVSPEYHPLAKTAKDAAAAAVLILAMTAAGVGACVLGPPLLDRLAR